MPEGGCIICKLTCLTQAKHHERQTSVQIAHGIPDFCGVAGDRPFLISGADDRTAKVWDYQTKACVQVSRHQPRTHIDASLITSAWTIVSRRDPF